MAKLGNIQIQIEKENESSSVDVTSYPVEEGINISDHVEQKPDKFSITGSITSETYKEDYEYLKKCMNNGTTLKYVGRFSVSNVLITDLSKDADYQISNGINISVDLQKVRFAKSSYRAKKGNVQNSGKKKPVVKKKNTKKYHVMKRGETYSHLRMWYGTSLKQLRAWNKYPDRKIPTGARLRVK